MRADPELYDGVADKTIAYMMKAHKIPTPEEAMLWSWRPGWYDKYKGDIDNIPRSKAAYPKTKNKELKNKTAKQVMLQRKQAMEDAKLKFNLKYEDEKPPEPSANNEFEQGINQEKQQQKMQQQQQQMMAQQAEQERMNPDNWSTEQTKDYFKQNPPKTPQEEQQMKMLLEQKKQQAQAPVSAMKQQQKQQQDEMRMQEQQQKQAQNKQSKIDQQEAKGIEKINTEIEKTRIAMETEKLLPNENGVAKDHKTELFVRLANIAVSNIPGMRGMPLEEAIKTIKPFAEEALKGGKK